MIISRMNAEHYIWGDNCDGYVLVGGPDLLVIEERMPPGTAEQCHFHQKARQFFRVLAGELTMVLDGEVYRLKAGSGIEIAPGQRHQARNDSDADVCFLVISSPTTRGDRIACA